MDLETLARAQFPDLTAAEIKMLQAAPKGEVANCSPNPGTRDIADDPRTAQSWGTERQIQAKLIRWLCVDRLAKGRVDPKGIQVFAAKISGTLDLSSVTVPFPLTLAHCSLNNELNLRYAMIPGINLQGTRMHSIAADGVEVKNHIFLRHGFHASGQIRLNAAKIGGALECDGGTFENAARFGAPESGIALIADGATVDGGVFLRNSFSAVGEVRLLGAQIGGYVDCTNATFRNPGIGIALSADGIVVKGTVLLGAGFRAEGEVKLLGAQIEGNLELSGANLSNPYRTDISASGDALIADRVIVSGNAYLGKGFYADGEVRLLGAQIGGDLDCDGGKFKASPRGGINVRNRALSAHSATVKGNVFLRNGFHAEGEVGFAGAKIIGRLECTAGAFHGELSLETASIGGGLFWKNIVDPQCSGLDLMSASIATLDDDSQSWPESGKLLLDGLVYERFSWGAPKDAKRRLNWLARQGSFAAQPFRQLSRILTDEGDVTGGKRILFEMEHLRAIQKDRAWYRRFWSLIQRKTVGYGYYPGRSLWCLLGLVVLGWTFYSCGYATGSIVPTDKDAYAMFKQTSQLPPHHESFYPFIYALENSVPLVKFGQADRWQPDPNQQWVCKPSKWVPQRLCRVLWPGSLRLFRWAQICLGWFFTTMGLAAVSGIIRKD